MIIMKKGFKIVSLIFFLFTYQSYLYAQPSYSTSIAFRLIDENKEFVDMEKFKEEYKIANVYGDFVDYKYFENYIHYNPKNHYFYLYINTIGPRYSFALYHANNIMTMFIPFNRDSKLQKKYALDIKVIEGDFLLEFKTKEKNKIIVSSYMQYYRIENINWEKQKRKFLKSVYLGDERIYRNKK